MSGPQHTAGSPSPLAPLSGCHWSNLSPAPEAAAGHGPLHFSKEKRESSKEGESTAEADRGAHTLDEQQVIMG